MCSPEQENGIFEIYELVSSVSPWSWLLSMMHLSTVDCSSYLLGYLLWATLCQVLSLSIYVINTFLIFMYICTWIFCWGVCECFHVWCYVVRVEIFGLFVLVFILSENEWHIRYVFDIQVGVINIFDGDDVWTFLFTPMIYIDNGGWSMAGLTVSALWQASSKLYLFKT